MSVKRTTVELDEVLVAEAVDVTGGTLRATVEQGLRLVIERRHDDDRRCQEILDRHLASAADGIDVDVLMSGEGWR